jgi:sugar/nucleoside kinase (ribokinase family)
VSELDLLVVGDVNADLVLRGGELAPRFGQREQLVDSASLVLGGSGAIVAAGAARLGLRVAMAGCVGDDVLGRAMLEALDGVDVSAVRRAAEPTGISVGLARPGDRAVLTALGALASFTADDVPADLLREARWVHVTSPFLQPALDVAAIASRAAGTTSLDPGWDPAERWELARDGFDVLMPNAQEAQRLSGEEEPEAAARRLAAEGTTVVVKLGESGALASTGGAAGSAASGGGDGPSGAAVIRAAAPRVEPVDATGAGDSFDAGFIAARLAGEDLAAALALGCACGALSTRAPGGTAGQPTLEEARSLRRLRR